MCGASNRGPIGAVVTREMRGASTSFTQEQVAVCLGPVRAVSGSGSQEGLVSYSSCGPAPVKAVGGMGRVTIMLICREDY